MSTIRGQGPSKKNFGQKLSEIVAVIAEKQGDAAAKSTQFASRITAAIGSVLSAEGDTRSAHQFAKDLGLDLGAPPSPETKEALTGSVDSLLKQQTGDSDARKAGEAAPSAEPQSDSTVPANSPSEDTRRGGEAPSPNGTHSIPNPATTESQRTGYSRTAGGIEETQNVPGVISPENVLPPESSGLPATRSITVTPLDNPSTSPTPPTLPSAAGLPSAPSTDIGPSLSPGGIPDLSHTLKPETLADGFNHGLQTGSPLSNSTEALSNAFTQGAQHFVHSPVAHPSDFSTPTGTLSASTAPSSGGFLDAGPAPVAASPVAAPVAPTPTAAAVPMSPGGPLPAYGADLRPATPTPVAAVPLPPLAGAPASAAVSPSNAPAGGIAQPAVVNKAAVTPAPSAANPVNLTESASAAALSGATAGAVSTHDAATARLRRHLESVARQQPKLAWAIADLDDGTTVLVTDVASGWIPPDVEIPTGVNVLPPEQRRGGLEALVRDAVHIQTWAPGQYLPDPLGDDVAMSLRARDLPAVDELNWEITQATNWRDGLPRLAHTLTKAGIAGTGILEAEATMLADHLRSAADHVLDAYPDIDSDAVGNWQLLAAINALISGQRTALNYHFAWFQALHSATHGS